MLVNNFGATLGIASRAPRHRLDQDLDLARCGNGEKAKTEEAAKLFHPWIMFATATSLRGTNRQPDLIAGGSPVNGLQHQVEGERQLEFADDEGCRLAVAQRHQVTAAHLALDLEAELFEEVLDRQIEA